jgi:hypothetical protein
MRVSRMQASPPQRLGFVEEASLGIRVAAEIGADELDGDGAIEERLSALVDDSHPAVAEDLGHFEIGQPSRQLLG